MSQARVILNAGVFPADLETKLARAEQLGFNHIEIGNTDLTTVDRDLNANAALLQSSPLEVSAFHELKDFLGHPSQLMEYKMNLAKSNLRLMTRVGAKLLIVSPATCNYSAPDQKRMVEELRALSMLGTVRGIRIGFKPLPWSDSINTYHDAITLVNQAANANLCLVIDNLAANTGSDLSELFSELPIEKVGLVQLSATDQLNRDKQPLRLLPTALHNQPAIPELVSMLEQKGYLGHYSLYAEAEPYRASPERDLMTEIIHSRDYICGLITQTRSQ